MRQCVSQTEEGDARIGTENPSFQNIADSAGVSANNLQNTLHEIRHERCTHDHGRS